MDLKGAEIRNVKNLCSEMGSKENVPMRVNIPYYQRPYKWGEDNIKNLINDYNKSNPSKPHVYLLGSVDGVGFIENPNGTIVKMLNYFDEFVQMNTTFKIGIFLFKLGLMPNLKGIYLDDAFFDDDMILYFSSIIKESGLKIVNKSELNKYKCIVAGKGILCM